MDEALAEARAAGALYPDYPPGREVLARAQLAAAAERVAAGDAALTLGDLAAAEASFIDARQIVATAPGVREGLPKRGRGAGGAGGAGGVHRPRAAVASGGGGGWERPI